MSAIKAEALRYSVRRHFWTGHTQILSDVSLTVERGEIFGFLGPNGAGKTTTIKTLLGLLRPDAGTVRLLGQDPREASARTRVGYLPETPYFPEFLTPLELLATHGRLAGLTRAEVRQRAGAALEIVGLAGSDQRIGTFSKGMLQRLGLAQALMAEPDAVILDEPMSGLDPLGRRDVREIMVGLRAAGKTVFFSTHILPDVEMVCDRVGIIINGRSRRTGRLDELLGDTVSGVDVSSDPCDDAVQDAAARLSETIDVGPGAVVFRTASLEQANQVVDLLRERNVTLRDVHVRNRSLEDLFVREAEETEP